MGSDYTSREKLKDMAAATGNTKYYELVAMPLDKKGYIRGGQFELNKFGDSVFVPYVWFDWETNPEFVEVVW